MNAEAKPPPPPKPPAGPSNPKPPAGPKHASNMGELTPEQRSMRARLAAHEKWANTADRSAATAPARAALADRFEREVDPDGLLDPKERATRAASAKKAYYTRLALLSSKARGRKAA